MAGGSRNLHGADSKPGIVPIRTHGQTHSTTAALLSNPEVANMAGTVDGSAERGIDGPAGLSSNTAPSPCRTAHGPPTSNYMSHIEDILVEEQSNHSNKRTKPAGNASAVSAPKRRATGILSTAISWARSQEADLAAFGGTKALEEPSKPLPPLPVPNRKQAAAEHDMLKASQRMQQQPRATRSGIVQSSQRKSASPVKQSNRAKQPQKPSLHVPVPDSIGGYPAAVPQHPVEIAFSNGTDEQMAAYVGSELGRLNEIAQADPNQYAVLAEECKRWAAGAIPTVAGLTTEDLEQAQMHLKAAMANSAAALGSTTSNRPMLPPDPRASSYFIQPGQQSSHPRRLPYPYQESYGGASGKARQDAVHREQRYPRRSCRGRNKKQYELYLTLDSDYEVEDEDDDDDDLQYARGERARGDGRRGPGRPRKQADAGTTAGPSSQRYALQNDTPRSFQLDMASMSQQISRLHPQLPGQPSPSAAYLLGEVLSPFAQFLFEQQGPEKGSTTKAGVPTGDSVDFAALDDFIAGLNFANDAVLGSPGAAAMLKMAGAARGLTSPATAALVQPILPASAALGAPLLPGMVPLPGMVAMQQPEAMAAAAAVATTAAAGPELSPSMRPPAGMEIDAVVTVKTSPQDPNTTKSPPSHKLLKPLTSKSVPASAAGPPLVAPVLPPILDLDLAVCKPLETPTLAGMLSLGLSKKSPTHPTPSMASPPLNSLLSPTLLNLHF